jgi:ubiquinone biosynthesis protein
MSIFSIGKTTRHIGRYGEIIGILLKYGFEDIIDQLSVNIVIRKLRSWHPRRKKPHLSEKSRPERVRLALEELGPTFIKLGQMLSTRYDILPLEYLTELRKLQDRVAPFPAGESLAIVEKELGRPVNSAFADFDEEPIAAASIAQVHRAVTGKGDQVVVKVRRPDIIETIENDIPILEDLARLMESHIPESQVYDPSGLVSQFKSWISEELDFIQEARNIHRFQKNFDSDETVYVPDVYWDLSSESVLTLEYIDGIYVDDVDAIAEAGMDPSIIAKNGTLFVLRQIFEFHFFHGDPHPSNILVLPGHVIAPLDYGLMGRLDDVLVGQIGDMLRGIIKEDASLIVSTLISLNRLKTDVDRDKLRIDVSDLLAHYHAVPLSMLKFERFFNDMVRVIRNNSIQFPRSLYLIGKALMLMEGIAQRLDPEYNLVTTARSYFTRTRIGRAEADKLVRNASMMLDDYSELALKAPRMISQILKNARWGKMGVNLHHMRMDDMIKQLDRSSNRLSFSMIIASMVVGSSLIMRLDKGPRLWDLPLFGLVGFTLAGLLGLWLIFNILRSGHL